jgi:hypothetical protein
VEQPGVDSSASVAPAVVEGICENEAATSGLFRFHVTGAGGRQASSGAEATEDQQLAVKNARHWAPAKVGSNAAHHLYNAQCSVVVCALKFASGLCFLFMCAQGVFLF